MKESYPIPSYYGFPYIPWLFQMYQVVKTFTEQGVERNIDVAGSSSRVMLMALKKKGMGAQILSETN